MHRLHTGNLRGGHLGAIAAAGEAFPAASTGYAMTGAIEAKIRRAKALGRAANLGGEQPLLMGLLRQHATLVQLQVGNELPDCHAAGCKADGAFSSSNQEYA